MDHWVVVPEQPGFVGDRTVVDTATSPPTVERAHFVFTRQPTDGLIGAGLLVLVDRETAEALEDNVFGEVSFIRRTSIRTRRRGCCGFPTLCGVRCMGKRGCSISASPRTVAW